VKLHTVSIMCTFTTSEVLFCRFNVYKDVIWCSKSMERDVLVLWLSVVCKREDSGWTPIHPFYFYYSAVREGDCLISVFDSQ